jgi:hypothetical protein
MGEDEIEPSFAGPYDNGARRIPALEIDKLSRDRTCGCKTGAEIHEVARINVLGESGLHIENKGDGNQKSQNARHYFLASIDFTVRQAIIRLISQGARDARILLPRWRCGKSIS